MEFEQYRLLANSIQLVEVELDTLEAKKFQGDNGQLEIALERRIEPYPGGVAIFLRVILEFEGDGPFRIVTIHKGICEPSEDISEKVLNDYAYQHVVPLLLPYARECIANTVTRMGLPSFHIPTMDVLKSMVASTRSNPEEHCEQE